MRCMLFPQWDVMGRSPNLRYGKAHVTGSTHHASYDATHSRSLRSAYDDTAHASCVMRPHDVADNFNQIRDTLTTVRYRPFQHADKGASS